MTVRVDTLEAILTSPPSRTVPVLRSLSTAVLERVAAWWHQRSEMVMSEEWLQEHRWSDHDRD
jgi:hypothetical protein